MPSLHDEWCRAFAMGYESFDRLETVSEEGSIDSFFKERIGASGNLEDTQVQPFPSKAKRFLEIAYSE